MTKAAHLIYCLWNIVLVSVFAALVTCSWASAQSAPRNPFAFAIDTARDQTSPRFKIDAVIVTGDKAILLIDHHRYTVGDQVAGHQIVAISIEQVITTREGKRITHMVGASR
jgi:hypothetical protein